TITTNMLNILLERVGREVGLPESMEKMRARTLMGWRSRAAENSTISQGRPGNRAEIQERNGFGGPKPHQIDHNGRHRETEESLSRSERTLMHGPRSFGDGVALSPPRLTTASPASLVVCPLPLRATWGEARGWTEIYRLAYERARAA